jgi:acetyl-CoA carboxylase carboxyltransferase component
LFDAKAKSIEIGALLVKGCMQNMVVVHPGVVVKWDTSGKQCSCNDATVKAGAWFHHSQEKIYVPKNYMENRHQSSICR